MRMTAAELARYRAALDDSAGAAKAYVLRRLADEGAGLDTAGMRELAIEVIEDATSVFGDRAQSTAVDLFDEIMEADEIEETARPFGDLVDHGFTEDKVRYYARKVESGDAAGFAADASDLAAYYVHRSAWENLVRNCDLAHVRWARVPTGRETCGWCYMLAGRGFDYHSRASAMAGKHVGCDCVVVPGNKGSTVAGFNTRWFQKCWADCSDTVGGPLTPKETRALWDALDEGERARWRKRHGSKAYEKFHERKSVEHICAEVERRDAGWLYRGVEPPITFADDAWEAEIRSVRPWEVETAEKLKAHGFRCDFWRDYEKWAVSGRIQQVGLPDLPNGYELKALRTADGVNAVNRAMRDAGHKKGLKCCVIDNSWGRLDDSDVIGEIIAHQCGRHVEDVLLIRSDGSLRRFVNKEARAGTIKAQAGASGDSIARSSRAGAGDDAGRKAITTGTEGVADMPGAGLEGPSWPGDPRERRRRDFRIAVESVRAVFIEPSPKDAERRAANARLLAGIRKVTPKPGWYDVHAHGSANDVTVFSSSADARTLAHIIRSRSDYHGEPIRLFSCHTGEARADGTCYGQELSDILGAEVDAPPGVTTINPDGSFYFCNDPEMTEFRHFGKGLHRND